MRRMTVLRAVLGLWISLMVVGVGPVSAQTAQTPPAPHIFSVVPDLTGTTLIVSGMRFGDGAEVWVEGQAVPVLPGATDERLEIDVPAAWRVQPGTYRLIVRTAAGRTDSFEVMVGAAGILMATEADAEGRRAGSPTEMAAAGPHPVGRAGARGGMAGAPGGSRPGIAPALREDVGPPYATAVGSQALSVNTASGLYNTAAGRAALAANTTGTNNTGTGIWALAYNTTGGSNTSSGASALYANTTGTWNTAHGLQALATNTTGSFNTAAGVNALFSNTTGYSNTAVGASSLYANTTGSRTVALGYEAGIAQTTGSDNVYVANAGVAAESGTIRIGTAGTHTDTYLAGTVRATEFVGDGAGLTNVTCAGSGGSSVPPSAPDSRAVVSELQNMRLTITAQASQLAEQAGQLAAQTQQLKAQTQREASQDQRLVAQAQRQTAQEQLLKAQAQREATGDQQLAAQADQLVALQQRLAQLEALLRAAPRPAGKR
jgi:hypothetical protein